MIRGHTPPFNKTGDESCWGKEDPLDTSTWQEVAWGKPLPPHQEYTGGSVSYYQVLIKNPTTGPYPYTAECNDIIEALGMNYAEGNAFKAIWRRCAARMGMSKEGYKDGLYDAEKVVFFGQRLVAQEKSK